MIFLTQVAMLIYGIYFYETFWRLLDRGRIIRFLFYCKKTNSMNQGNVTKMKNKINVNHKKNVQLENK